jgi:asparagine synthase (glutamine-hydrolysing)
LVKTDRATMSASVEGRLPFLDPELVAFSWRLPTSFLVDRRRGKKLLRNIVERRLGPAVARAPKRGFSVPLAGWLRGPLRSWAEELLSSSDLDSAGLVPEPIRGRWRQHLTGDVDSSHYLWNVLMLMGWLRT